ncbi:MAG TPA: TIGR00730 family Rossman fold protein [Solirubrobacterales bacterium]|jgi:hypothetical protein
MKLDSVCVFAGSADGSRADYPIAAESLGRSLAERGIRVVNGGSGIGLMGRVADAALAAGGQAIGVIPESLMAEEIAHQGLSELRVVGSMHERKAQMSELADAFVALPGGLGTFEELLEAATWSKLGLQAKPCGVLNVDGYFDPLVELIEGAVSNDFLGAEYEQIFVIADDPQELLGRLADWQPPVGWQAPVRTNRRRAA